MTLKDSTNCQSTVFGKPRCGLWIVKKDGNLFFQGSEWELGLFLYGWSVK